MTTLCICNRPWSCAREVRRTVRVVRRGINAGARVEARKLECECGERTSQVRQLTPESRERAQL